VDLIILGQVERLQQDHLEQVVKMVLFMEEVVVEDVILLELMEQLEVL
jgi:hypothetical protein